jgi:hypothetical protein
MLINKYKIKKPIWQYMPVMQLYRRHRDEDVCWRPAPGKKYKILPQKELKHIQSATAPV